MNMGDLDRNQDKPVALVTGASRGIGRATALKLAQQGYHVIALARTVGALEELDDAITKSGGSCTLVPCDLKDLDRLMALGPQLAERFGRLDVFVANAAMLGGLSPLAQTKPDVWGAVWTVNVHANHRLIGTLDPLLRASSAQVVLVSSGAVQSCKAYWGLYAATKSALEAMGKCYAAEVQNAKVKVHIFDPGRVATSMRAEAYPGEDQSKLSSPDEVADRIIDLCTDGMMVNAGNKVVA